jgi:hypothetical protein
VLNLVAQGKPLGGTGPPGRQHCWFAVPHFHFAVGVHKSPLTRTWVTLLGPCYKTGQVASSISARRIPKRVLSCKSGLSVTCSSGKRPIRSPLPHNPQAGSLGPLKAQATGPVHRRELSWRLTHLNSNIPPFVRRAYVCRLKGKLGNSIPPCTLHVLFTLFPECFARVPQGTFALSVIPFSI